ncbi:hypothetical protein [Streptomyces chartreusis]
MDRVRCIAGSWQEAVIERASSGHTGFLQDDGSRIVGIWTEAHGDGIDSKKVNDLELTMASDADSRAVETEEALSCIRHPTECG